MTVASERLAELLHRSRSPGWTSDDAIALSDAIRAASSDECTLALFSFGQALLAAARNVVQLQRDAAVLAETVAQYDQQGGALQ